MQYKSVDETVKRTHCTYNPKSVDETVKRTLGIYNTKYGSKSLVPMDSFVAKDLVSMSAGGEVMRVQALVDSGSSASIISLDLARQLGLEGEGEGSAKLEDVSGTRMDVTAIASVAVR